MFPAVGNDGLEDPRASPSGRVWVTRLLMLLDGAGPGTSPENAAAMVALLAIPVSIGCSVGSALAPHGGE